MSRLSSFFKLLILLGLALGLVGVIGGAAVYAYLAPQLPSIETLREVRLQTPLRVYTRDGNLVAEFGEKRREPITLDEVPEQVVQAFLAAEDERFFTHPGVDWQGLTRAVMHIIRTGRKGPGGSTITMQVARNFFLGREKTYVRKLNEILLALKIERELTKQEILELYVNKIFLGQRSYGIAAASQVYYGRPLDQLKLEQVAMIAGLPKAPSRFNPVVNPERATTRRDYVLGRMRELNFITEEAYQAAKQTKVSAKVHGLRVESQAGYLAEMVRAHMEEKHGDEAYTAGFQVYLTASSKLQDAGNAALRKALLSYDRRHGYRGAEAKLSVDLTDSGAVLAELDEFRPMGGLIPAAVIEVAEQSALVLVRGGAEVELPWDGIKWARVYKSENRRGPKLKRATDVLAAGDVIRVQLEEEGWRLAQLPEIEGALVAIDPRDGAIKSLVGGFDFAKSKFNRAVQAERQPGSSFKPFIYSAALEKGYTAASFINDAPVVFDDVSLEDAWRPENYSGKFYGPTRLREALYKSRNLVSIRLMQAIGIQFAIDHARRFGLDADRLAPNLSLSLGSGEVRPIDIARGYTVLANGGYLVEPYFIEKVVVADEVVFEANPARVCRECPDVSFEDEQAGVAVDEQGRPIAPRSLDAANAYIMSSIMRDVVLRGTAASARRHFKRRDLAGKTGTTNDQNDAWFAGFVPSLAATAWVGFDKLKPLGRRETGGRAALPMWIEFMKVALEDVPEEFPEQPPGVVSVRIDPVTGKLAAANAPDGEFEVFRAANAPTKISRRSLADTTRDAEGNVVEEPQGPQSGDVTKSLF